MDVKIQKKNAERMEFLVTGTTISFANALRRTMVTEIPVLAVDWIEVHDNTSAVFDEMIAQRLGLLPLVFDPEKFNFQDGCKCEGKGCSLCQVVFACERTGPCVVYSGDLKSANKAVKPWDDKFPIAELLDGQSLKFEATARLGRGREHAKFQAANAVFANHPEFNKEDKPNTQPEGFVFRVESISSLPPEYIVTKAAELLEEKIKEFKKAATDL